MRTRLTAAVLTVLAMLLLAPAALAAPPESGKYPPLPSTRYANWALPPESYQGYAVVRGTIRSNGVYLCEHVGGTGPRPSICREPSAKVLTYVKTRGTWRASYVNRSALTQQAWVTSAYSRWWSWIWSPSSGLRLVARTELAVPNSLL